jgi:uncharacterized protein (TIGR02996 family)
MTAEEKGFLASIKKDSNDATVRGAYADWLDEHDRPYEALLQRDKAGVSEAWFKLRRKSDGLFSEGLAAGRRGVRWSAKGKMWRKLGDLRGHLVGLRHHSKYGGDTPWEELEVVVIEIRLAVTATLPVQVTTSPGTGSWSYRTITVVEPLGAESKTEK